MAQTILVVDDDPVQRRLLETAITRSGMTVVTAPGGQPALDLIAGPKGDQISLMLLDLVMPDMGGLDVLAKLRPSHPDLPVIVLTAKGGIDSAVEAMRAGANDFLVKPASPERIGVSIRNQLKIGTLSGEVKTLKKKTENKLTFDDLVATSQEMKQVFRLGARAAQSDIPVLIEGESGAGKELIARAIQGTSARSGRPFVTVNCGAIPENLIESILFGHEKGSFTGASDKHLGKFQEADGGTLFLDEIGELRLDMQVKLLRALQEGEVDPVGSKRPVKVDVRIIAATNRDLGQMARDNSFREDLYYRLNVFPVTVPPLRARPGDIAPLARFFIERFAAEENKPVAGLTPQALTLIERFSWPGNVRQLENTIFRAVVLCDGASLDVCDFPQIAAAMGVETLARQNAYAPAAAGEMPIPATGRTIASPYSLSMTGSDGHIRRFEDMESEIIKTAITRYEGHMSEVARRLGIGRSTLYRKLKEFGLEPDIANEPMARVAEDTAEPMGGEARKAGLTAMGARAGRAVFWSCLVLNAALVALAARFIPYGWILPPLAYDGVALPEVHLRPFIALVLYFPTVWIGANRLHDIGRSGWGALPPWLLLEGFLIFQTRAMRAVLNLLLLNGTVTLDTPLGLTIVVGGALAALLTAAGTLHTVFLWMQPGEARSNAYGPAPRGTAPKPDRAPSGWERGLLAGRMGPLPFWLLLIANTALIYGLDYTLRHLPQTALYFQGADGRLLLSRLHNILYLPAYAAAVRRLHDQDRPGTLVIAAFLINAAAPLAEPFLNSLHITAMNLAINFVTLYLLFLCWQKGNPDDNRYGPPPGEEPAPVADIEPPPSPPAARATVRPAKTGPRGFGRRGV